MDIKGKILTELDNGDLVRRFYKGIIMDFAGRRRVISTSVLNGGIRDDLQHIFNYNCLADEMSCSLKEDSYEKELAANARDLELDAAFSSGISTAAWMENASIKQESYKALTVTAIVTGGIDKNGARAGDPASFYEEAGSFTGMEAGTINILLHVNANLNPGSLARLLVTCSEAKAIACEELLLGSNYSTGLATGSGTDGTIIVSDLESSNVLTDAGKHSKLGELVGKTVKEAVKEALYLQTGAGFARQHKIRARAKRYGITTCSLWDFIENNKAIFEEHGIDIKNLDIIKFEKILDKYDDNSSLVVCMSLYCHILDQIQTGMLEWAEGIRECKNLISNLWTNMGLDIENPLFVADAKKNVMVELIEELKYCIDIVLLKQPFY